MGKYSPISCALLLFFKWEMALFLYLKAYGYETTYLLAIFYL